MKIAKFKDLQSTYKLEYILERQDDVVQDTALTRDVRITEWLHVEWVPRKAEEVVPAQLAALETAEAELRRKFAEKLHEIAEQRGKLLALTHQSDSPAAAPGASAAQGTVASSDGMAPAAGDSPSSAAGGPSNLPPGYSPEDDKYSYLRDEAYAERRAEEW